MNSNYLINTGAAADQVIAETIIDAIQDVKGKHITHIDLRKLSDAPTDRFIICEGDSTTQVKAISDKIARRLKEELGLNPSHVEGEKSARWICVDYFNVVVHIFYREVREFYDLENLWNDGEVTMIEA